MSHFDGVSKWNETVENLMLREALYLLWLLAGVVGLPGSGKKLLVDTLFRLVGVKHGRILIGGTDVTYVPLQKLRSKMAIVAQDPVLFAGTIR
jgi:ABC-type multidrug transport system fused ATPase/permease subunit